MNPDPSRDDDVERAFAALTHAEFPVKEPDTFIALDIFPTTLIFGGGPDSGYNDEITPIRPSSVRGHLRFWWRATRGARFEDVETLGARESEIWGDQDHPSPVRISIDCISPPQRSSLDSISQFSPIRYGLFPPYEEKKEKRNLLSPRLYKTGHFRLNTYVKQEERNRLGPEIRAALWAWLNFGGIGARTRRGAGALYSPQFAGWTDKHLESTSGPRDWPSLPGGTLLWGSKKLPWHTCWETILAFYKAFRQDRLNLRGRTRWPEPEEIRNLRTREMNAGADGFPRGALGLPINFHFKDWGAPPDQILSAPTSQDTNGESADPVGRLASPVILRPFAVSPTHAFPSIIVLNTRRLDRLELFELADKKRTRAVSVPSGKRDAVGELLYKAAIEWDAKAVRL